MAEYLLSEFSFEVHRFIKLFLERIKTKINHERRIQCSLQCVVALLRIILFCGISHVLLLLSVVKSQFTDIHHQFIKLSLFIVMLQCFVAACRHCCFAPFTKSSIIAYKCLCSLFNKMVLRCIIN